MRLKICVGIMLAIGLMLQGCGRKGPLKLPVPDHFSTPTSPVALTNK